MRRGQVPETRNCTSRQGHSGPRGKARFGFGLEFSQAHVTRTRRDTLTTPRTRPAAHGYAASPSILTTAPSSSDVPSSGSSRSSGAARQSGYASRRRLAQLRAHHQAPEPSRVEAVTALPWQPWKVVPSGRVRKAQVQQVVRVVHVGVALVRRGLRVFPQRAVADDYWLLATATGYWLLVISSSVARLPMVSLLVGSK